MKSRFFFLATRGTMMEGNTDIFFVGDDALGYLDGPIHKKLFHDIYLEPSI